MQKQRQLQRKIRILKSELKMLQNYYDESHKLFKEYEQEWLRDLAYFQEKFKEVISPQSDDSEPIESRLTEFIAGDAKDEDPFPDVSAKFHPEWAKKLFRKIALLTHPDRATPEDKERLERLFLRASAALESEDHEVLLSLALDLAIPIDIDAPELRPLLEKRIDQIKERITSLEHEISWIWGESFGLPEIRISLLRAVFASDGIDIGGEELSSEISKREKTDADG